MAATASFTIDELARRVGMTTRNIRAHQTRGLLPPPSIEGRTGRYGPEHVERLELIRRLQDQGLNLQAIALVLAEQGEEIARLRRAVLEPWATEAPFEQPVEELARRFGGTVDADAVARATGLGILEPVDERTVRVLLPAVLRDGEAMLAIGVPLAAQLDAVEEVDRHVRAVADAYLALAREHLVGALADQAAVDPGALRAAVEGLRSIAADVLQTLFQRAMTEGSARLVEDLAGP